MGGSKKTFEAAMQEAANAAWERKWEQAAQAYERALAEFPKDVNALSGMGLALSGIDQWEAALEAYRQASENAPDDPVLMERKGQVLEQLGRNEEAAAAYVAAATRYIESQQATDLAVKRWQDAISSWPDCPEAHARLLLYYQDLGQVSKAVAECLELARVYQASGQRNDAVQACEYALHLDPHHPDLHSELGRLRREGQETSSDGEAQAQAQGSGVPPMDKLVGAAPQVADTETRENGKEARPSSPVRTAHEKALGLLAESLFEEDQAPANGNGGVSKAERDALIGRAIDQDTRGKAQEAIEAYESAVQAGVDHPGVHFNLGLLYEEALRFDEAAAEFGQAITDPDYELGSRFALGECHRARGRLDEALEQFIEALRIIDLNASDKKRTDELDQLYRRMANGLLGGDDRQGALEFTNSLVTFLSVEGWEKKVSRARERLDALAKDGPALSLAEMLAMQDSEQVLESLSLAQEYLEKELHYAGLEECHYALGRSPTCLPIHRQIAEIKLQMGKPNQAVGGLVAIGDSYRTRGNSRQAAAMYERALKLAPMNTVVRSRVIELLKTAGDPDGTLRHYVGLADTHYQLAQMDEARQVYEEALNFARRSEVESKWAVQILHRMGDIDMQRVDWKKAMDVYRQIRKVAPNDEKACLALIDLYQRLNRPELAMTELDGLVKMGQESGNMERAFTYLETAVKEKPDDVALRTRLAQAYLDSGDKDQALQHLDKLGDLQLDSGRHEDAKATIRAIIMLRPPNIDSYQQLLAQLEGRDEG